MIKLKKKLIDFESRVKKIYEKGKIKAPIHLSGGNEDHLIKIFKKIKKKRLGCFKLEKSLPCSFTWNTRKKSSQRNFKRQKYELKF